MFFPLEWLALKRIIYQIIFIQLWRNKKEEKGVWGEEGPFAVLIALQCLQEALLRLSKLTQPGPCVHGSSLPRWTAGLC